MKRKTILILICLAFINLACLQTAMTASNLAPTSPVEVTQTLEQVSVEISPTGTAPVAVCANVIASESLNIRDGASEHTPVMGWLQRGDIVRVTDQSDPEWWGITIGDLEGFVKAEYLVESECER